ncbi:hypothetical protein, conserved, partial [Trypanosoma cruzi]
MGVFGLRRFIDASSCTRFLPETVQDAEKPLAARDLDKTHGTAGNSALSSSPAATPH